MQIWPYRRNKAHRTNVNSNHFLANTLFSGFDGKDIPAMQTKPKFDPSERLILAICSTLLPAIEEIINLFTVKLFGNLGNSGLSELAPNKSMIRV